MVAIQTHERTRGDRTHRSAVRHSRSAVVPLRYKPLKVVLEVVAEEASRLLLQSLEKNIMFIAEIRTYQSNRNQVKDKPGEIKTYGDNHE